MIKVETITINTSWILSLVCNTKKSNAMIVVEINCLHDNNIIMKTICMLIREARIGVFPINRAPIGCYRLKYSNS